MRSVSFLSSVLTCAAVATIAPLPSPAAGEGGKGGGLAAIPENISRVVFATRKPGVDGHWYANFSYYAESTDKLTYRPGGRLSVLDLKTGQVTHLIDDPAGGVRDPVVHYDGKTILFSYRRGESRNYHLYEINADGAGLKQLTDGQYDDFEPCYLPDGGVAFVSSRCKRWVNCWLTQVAVLHRMNRDGSGIRPLSSNNEHDNTPWVLPDGRLLYQRWEYVDRSQVHYHHLWTAYPDGTAQMVLYGNMRPGILMIDAKPIPGTHKVVSVFSPGHGRKEHAGAIVVIDPKGGPDSAECARTIHAGNDFRDPWAFSEDAFLVARGAEMLVMDGEGGTVQLHVLSAADRKAGFALHEPRPLVARRPESVIPPRTDLGRAHGELVLANVYEGRNMRGVKPGSIKKLLVLETLPKPINYTGGMDPLSYAGTFTLERIVGEVPVEADGSAYMELPALRSLFFVALDRDDMAVKRMQSFLTVQPGEQTSCAGCHEQRTTSYQPRNQLAALSRPPSRVQPIADCPDIFDYPRDIQPILDSLCVECHGYDRTAHGGPAAGGVILTGDRGPMFSHSYFMMTVKKLFSDGRNLPKSNYAPYALGSGNSRILKILDGSHHGVVATSRQRKMLRLWIESAAAYPGTYASLGTGMIGGYYQNRQVHTDRGWATTRAGAEVINRRCAGCHNRKKQSALPESLSDEIGLSFWRPGMDDKRMRFHRHIVFNLSRPEKSLMLLAPLAEESGGFGRCKSPDGESARIFAGVNDPGYRRLLAMIAAGKDKLDEIKRFDMPGFQPRDAYIREMKRYGVLPADLPPGTPIDPYETDRAYWESLWYKPVPRQGNP